MKKTWQKFWIDIILVDLFAACMISILLLLTSFVYEAEPSEISSVKWEFVKKQDKDYNIHILTDAELSTLYSYKPEIRLTNAQIVDITQEEAQLLLSVGRAEGGPTLIGQLWTMRTIINRVESEDFPDNISDVINQEGQFEVVWTGKYKEAEINANSHLALAMVEGGWNETEGALYWEANSNSKNSWHAKNRTFIKEVEGNKYYK